MDGKKMTAIGSKIGDTRFLKRIKTSRSVSLRLIANFGFSGLVLTLLVVLGRLPLQARTLNTPYLRRQLTNPVEMAMQALLDLEGSLLDAGIADIGDTSTLQKSAKSAYIEEFVNISDQEDLGSGFSNIVGTGTFEYAPKNQELRTTVSWSVGGCICLDIQCRRTAAVDLVGVTQADNGEYRGYSPIILLDEQGQDIPCHAAHSRPITNYTSVRYEGCDVVGNEINATSRTIYPRLVENCTDGEIQSLRLYDGDRLIGRTINNTETMPILSNVSPDVTMASMLDSVQFLPLKLELNESISVGPFRIPVRFEMDIADELKSMVTVAVKSAFNAVGQLRSPDFNPTAGQFSDAPIHEIARLSDRFSLSRMISAIRAPSNQTIWQWPLYGDAIGAHPDASQLDGVLSSVGLLLLAASIFGCAVGTFWRRHALGDLALRHWAAVAGSLASLIFQTTAFGVMWRKELEQNAFSVSLVTVETIISDRFSGIVPLKVGMDGTMLAVVTSTVHIEDASNNFNGLFIFGSILSSLALVVATLLAHKKDFD